MTPNETTAALAALLDKQAITEVIYRFARGLDRIDATVLRSVFWEDATDDHGIFVGPAARFVEWVVPVLRGIEHSQHLIGNVLITLDGDRAESEAYFHAYHREIHDGQAIDRIAAGRYLDRFERRRGEWRIRHRQAVYDWSRFMPAADQPWLKAPLVNQLTRGARAPDDPSYGGR